MAEHVGHNNAPNMLVVRRFSFTFSWTFTPASPTYGNRMDRFHYLLCEAHNLTRRSNGFRATWSSLDLLLKRCKSLMRRLFAHSLDKSGIKQLGQKPIIIIIGSLSMGTAGKCYISSNTSVIKLYNCSNGCILETGAFLELENAVLRTTSLLPLLKVPKTRLVYYFEWGHLLIGSSRGRKYKSPDDLHRAGGADASVRPTERRLHYYCCYCCCCCCCCVTRDSTNNLLQIEVGKRAAK